jgi:hypothetical protein
MVGLLVMIRNCIARGCRMIEGGRGEYDYKISCGGKNVPVSRIIICRSGQMWRVKALLAWADLFNYVYYRTWFQRIAPKLRQTFGGEAKPLWRSWIRLRV